MSLVVCEECPASADPHIHESPMTPNPVAMYRPAAPLVYSVDHWRLCWLPLNEFEAWYWEYGNA